MSFSIVVHDSVPHRLSTTRSSLLTCPRRPDATPIPPTLVNSPYLSSPHSVFRRKSTVHRWPSHEDDRWLRDMVPMDGSPSSDADARSDASHEPTPSPTSSDSSFGSGLFPPSPLLRPRSTGPEVPAVHHHRASGGPAAGQSLHGHG